MEEDYKGCHIQSTARHILESGRWVPHVVITWTKSGLEKEFIQFDVKSSSANELDAELEGLKSARNWIDATADKIRGSLKQDSPQKS